MTEKYHYYVANAFASAAFEGNPAGVFPNAAGLSDAQMQSIAKQLNLVETVFVFSPSTQNADFHLRYFTPIKELPIAGHPTIAAWTVLEASGAISLKDKTVYHQQTGAGLQEIVFECNMGSPLVFMQQPKAIFQGEIYDRARIANIFSISENDLLAELPIESINTGLGHIVFGVSGMEALMRAKRNTTALKQLCAEYQASEAQIFCRETYTPGLSLHTRNICPREGIEDPACGVGNGALLAYLMKNHVLTDPTTEIRAEQGHIENMPSVIYARGRYASDGGLDITVGGSAYIMSQGDLFLKR